MVAPRAAMLGAQQQLSAILNSNRALGRQKDKFALMLSPPEDDRQAEFYPPWESDNPQPGKATVQLFNRDPAEQQNLIAGDMLHYVGAVDPTTNKPIDSTFYALKQQFLQKLTPEQLKNERAYYQQQAPLYGVNPPSFEDWMNFSRGDELLMGYLTPDKADNFKRYYTPEQRKHLEVMRQYLKRGSIAPGMNR